VEPCGDGSLYIPEIGINRPPTRKSNEMVDITIYWLEYHEKTISEEYILKSGTVDMIYAILKLLLDLFQVNKITLRDTSYWRGPNGPVPLPERRLLSGKPTWYEEHFHAIPDASTRFWYAHYIRRREYKMSSAFLKSVDIDPSYIGQPVKQLFMDRYLQWTEKQINRFLHALRLPALSGNYWTIPKQQIRSYSLYVEWIEDLPYEANILSQRRYIRSFQNRLDYYTFIKVADIIQENNDFHQDKC
jgi:hypothetical protein